MMVWVHAAVGAGVGAALKTRSQAAGVGLFTHLVCDLIPHRDYDIRIEAPLALAIFVCLAARYGVRSSQFWGAAGAVLPDFENALVVAGAFSQTQTLFPTHNEAAPWFLGHGRRVRSPWPQIALAGIALGLAEKNRAQ